MTTDNTIIKVTGLKKSFGELDVLKGIDTEIKKGEVVVVIGPSGSGKSTFLRCLNRLEEPTGGIIEFDGVNITDKKVNINKHREKMGMVFQQFNLFNNHTILKNITLAPVKLGKMKKDEANKRAMELLERVGLAEKADAYPSQLSGGQKQRVAIVRALAMNPDTKCSSPLQWWCFCRYVYSHGARINSIYFSLCVKFDMRSFYSRSICASHKGRWCSLRLGGSCYLSLLLREKGDRFSGG